MKPSQKEEDTALVVAYQNGEEKALVQLVKRWHKDFCMRAFYIVKDEDEAKDIAQETWRTIMSKIGSLKDPNLFKSWSLRIVSTKAIDVLRKRSKMRDQKESLRYELNRTEEVYDERLELKQKLNNAIKQLPIEQQHVIRLFYVQNYSLNQIADILNIKAGTVKSRLYHAREKLKETLKTFNYEN